MPSERRFLDRRRAVRCAEHGAYEDWRGARTSTSCSRPRRPLPRLAAALYLGAGCSPPRRPSSRPRPLPRRTAAPRDGGSRPATTCRPPTTSGCRATSSRAAAAPWLDPYSFQPEVEPRVNFAGWPFAARLLAARRRCSAPSPAGTSSCSLTYVGAGGFAALWLRALGLPLGAALAGGLAFALAPYRVAQSTGHLLGPISMLLPLALYGRRAAARRGSRPPRSRRSRSRARCTSRSARSRSSLALRARAAADRGSVRSPRVAGRRRRRALVWALSLRDAAERPLLARSSATRRRSATSCPATRHEFERFVFLGWLAPRARDRGPGVLVLQKHNLLVAPARARARARRARPAACSRWARTCPATACSGGIRPLARDTRAGADAADRLPLPGRTRRRRDRLCFETQVLALALVGAVAARRWSRPTSGCRSTTRSNADEGNAVYAQRGRCAAGTAARAAGARRRTSYAGSVYLYYAMQAPRERPLGYSTAAPPEAFRVARELPGSPEEPGSQRRRRVP